MKESTKGALLSFLVYPGLGQLVLGFKSSGVVFAVLSTFGLLVIIYRITIRMFYAIDPFLSALANNTLSLIKIIEIVDQSSYDSWQVEGLSLVYLTFCWIAAGLHAYYTGRRIDRRQMPKADG